MQKGGVNYEYDNRCTIKNTLIPLKWSEGKHTRSLAPTKGTCTWGFTRNINKLKHMYIKTECTLSQYTCEQQMVQRS